MSGYLNGANDTYACDSSGCVLSCASPEFGPNTCYGLQQNFLDGTPCGGGGQCQNGQCQGSSVGKEIAQWVKSHKAIVIGVCVGVGVILILLALRCAFSFWRRRRYPPVQKRGRRRPPKTNAQLWPAPPVPPGEMTTRNANRSQPEVWDTNGNGIDGNDVGWKPNGPPARTWRYM